ncbi:phage portal protein [Elizabethkingia ursingii]
MAQELTIEQRMEQFKKRKTPLPDIAKYDSEYNVEKHKIFTDLINFPDREAEVIRKNEKGEEVVETITIPRNRIGLPYQKRTVNIATTFLFGNPVQYTNNLDDDTLYIAFKEVVSRNKMIYFDKDISNSVGRWKECAELWYDIEGESEYNSFKAVRTLKVKLLTPDIYNLYPVFDQTDNLISFGREFTIKEVNKDVRIFEVYTATEIITYRNEGSGWTEEIVQNLLEKIPIVYYSGKIEWEDVQTGIERLERIYSNVGESNDKFAFPNIFLVY